VASAGTLTLLNACSSCKDQSEALPNIILIMADDMGYETTGFNGGLSYNTPVLDRLASEGIRFTNCYSQPLSTPSRVKMMTGKYNFRNYEHFGYLNPEEYTFGNMMKNAGYNTCVVGKWQLNGLNRNNPGNQDVNRPYNFGFDEYCLWQLHHTPAEGERYANPLITQNGEDLPRDKDAYGPDVFSNYINDFIDRNVNEKFFIYYPMVLPHDPFVPTPLSEAWADSTKRYQQDIMYFRDMIEYIDLIVGRIEATLKEKGLWENTLLIFVADNGTSQRILSRTISGDVKGAKGLSVNGGNHVPMIAVDGLWTGNINFIRTFPFTIPCWILWNKRNWIYLHRKRKISGTDLKKSFRKRKRNFHLNGMTKPLSLNINAESLYSIFCYRFNTAYQININ